MGTDVLPLGVGDRSPHEDVVFSRFDDFPSFYKVKMRF
jgi:hypothetical protein